MNRPPAIWGIVPCLSKIDTLGPRGGAALGFDARAHSDQDCGCQWKRTDFPTEEALRKCKITRHEDLQSHIYLLLDRLGLQFRWIVTRMGKGRALVSSAALVVNDHKERTWMAMYANDSDVIEDLLYHRLKFLRSDCTDAIAIFAQHRVQDEFCAQKADVDRHFGDVNATLATLKFLESTIDLPLKSVPRQVLLTRSLKILTLSLMLNFCICLLWEAYRDCFPDFSLSLRFFSSGVFSRGGLSSLPGFALLFL